MIESTDLLKKVMAKNPKITKNLPENQANALVLAILHTLRDELTAMDVGTTHIKGLGRFKVTELEALDNSPNNNRRRIRYLPPIK